MDREYEEILLTRREIISDSLRWSPSLTAALLKHNVLSTDAIAHIEEETESKSRRVKKLLRELPHQKNAAFYAFIAAMEDLKCHELAIILRTDAAAKRTGGMGSSKETVNNMGRYIDMMDEQLVQRLEDPGLEQDTRTVLVAELRARLHDIGRFIRLTTQRKEQVRRNILRLVDPKHGILPPWTPPGVNLLDPDGLDEWDAHEAEVDKVLLSHVESYVESVEVELQQVEGEVRRLQSAMAEKQLQWKKDEQGKKVYVEAEALPKCGEHFIHVPKEDMREIMKMLKPHRKDRYDSSTSASTHGDRLLGDIQYLVDYVVGNLKDRLRQTSHRITQLEKEKGTVYATLEEEDLERPLQDVVMERLDHVTDERDDLEKEVMSLRKRIESLASEHRHAMQMMYENSERDSVRPSSAAPGRKTSVTGPRSRRISAPARPVSASLLTKPRSSSVTADDPPPSRRPPSGIKQRRVSHVK